MKNKTSIWIGLATLVAGVALILFNSSITSVGVVMTAGIVLILLSLANGLITIRMRKKTEDSRQRVVPYGTGIVLSGVGVVFGIVVLAMNVSFQQVIPVLFGAIVTIAALMLFYQLTWGVRPVVMPGWLYILPTLMVVLAVFTFMQHADNPDEDRRVMIFTGVALCLYSLCVFVGMAHLSALQRKAAKVENAEKAATSSETVSDGKPVEPRALDD